MDASSPLQLVLDRLACPICAAAMSSTPVSSTPVSSGPVSSGAGALACANGHSFDLARQGYVSFLVGAGSAHSGDTAEMVQARADFLGAGHYAPIADAVAAAIPTGASGLVLDLAGGTGFYLSQVLDAHPGLVGLALDVSVPASRRAARAHPRAAAVTADAWRTLPLRDESVAHMLNVFGPRNGAEMVRVLAPGGTVVVVTPRPGHLEELRQSLGMIGIQQAKDDKVGAQLSGLEPADRMVVEYTATLGHADVLNEVTMGPSAFHVDGEQLAARVAALPGQNPVTIAVTVTTYRKA
jgi:23S rRNA (guanine745-N1)-methyltransferase